MGAVSVSSSSEGLAPHGASRGGRCEDVSGGPDNEDSTTSEARRQGGVGTRGRLCELRPEFAHDGVRARQWTSDDVPAQEPCTE